MAEHTGQYDAPTHPGKRSPNQAPMAVKSSANRHKQAQKSTKNQELGKEVEIVTYNQIFTQIKYVL